VGVDVVGKLYNGKLERNYFGIARHF